MDNPTTWLFVSIFGGFYFVIKVLEKAVKELTLTRQQLAQMDLKPIAIEQAGQGSEIRTIAYELYLLRRIAEEKTGDSKDDVTRIDKERMDEKLAHLLEVIAKRDSSGEDRK